MNGALEFALNLTGMSGGLQQTVTSVKQGIGSIATTVQNVQQKIASSNGSIAHLNKVLSDLTQRRDLMVGTDSITRANRQITALQSRIGQMRNAGAAQAAVTVPAIANGSVTHLNKVLSDLTRRRDLMVGTDNITRANRQIIALQSRIGQIRNAGAAQQPVITVPAIAKGSLVHLNTLISNLTKRRDLMVGTESIARANRQIGELQSRINKIQNTGNGSGSNGIAAGVMLGSLGAGLISAGIGIAKQTAMDSIDAAMQFGMRTKSFEVLTGSATRGRELAAQLRELKMHTLVGGGVYQNAQTMMGFGMGGNSILRKIREVGDVGMGDTERMQALTLARSQTFAAGKLMGQDLLQYINAGFNPLSIMAEKWQQFGFKAKQSVGTLKDLMSEGKISSGMVDKAFELATSKGGMFYNMMERIGETPGGKMLKMKGEWAAMQIDIGNSLMPLGSSIMETTTRLMHFLKISSTVPETLTTEKLEINSLVGSITKLNEGNLVRGRMMDMLKGKFPDLFSGIDGEKTKNSELLTILSKVNEAYDKRIALAGQQLISGIKGDEINKLLSLQVKAKAQIDENNRLRNPNGSSIIGAMGFWDIKTSGLYERGKGSAIHPASLNAGLENFISNATKKIAELQGEKSLADTNVSNGSHIALLSDARNLIGNTPRMKELWGKNYAKNLPVFNTEVGNWQKMLKDNKGMFAGSFLKYDYSKLQRLVHPDGDGAGTDLSGAAAEKADNVIGGGTKVLHIHLAPGTVKPVFHVSSMKDATNEVFEEFEQRLVEVLYSVKSAL